MKKQFQPPTPAALYARVSSDRQDVDLSVAAQLRALQGLRQGQRLHHRPRVRGRGRERPHRRPAPVPQHDRRGRQGQCPFPGNPGLEIQQVHPQAGARRGLQVPVAKAQGHPRRLHHRARRRLPHRQADGGHHRELWTNITSENLARRGQTGDAGSRFPWFLPRLQSTLRLHPRSRSATG